MPGDCFGEISMLTGLPRTATAVANEDSVLLELKREVCFPLPTSPHLSPTSFSFPYVSLSSPRLLSFRYTLYLLYARHFKI